MRYGLPSDAAAWIALALAAAALAAARLAPGAASCAVRLTPRGRRLLVAAAALAAVLLSAAYIAAYLRGGPRIIDATSYWLEARALAAGHLAWAPGEPVASTIGRFLVRADAPGDPRVAVIFPPGYPALLALGFLARAPLAVGPLLAAALTIATWDLAARVASPASTLGGEGFEQGGGEAGRRERTIMISGLPASPPPCDPLALAPSPAPGSPSPLPLVPALAALFSVLCAALRYHTADTMSHGLAALCFTAALALTLRALDRPARPLPSAALAGLAAGWLAATRPPSALALAATLAALLWLRPRDALAHPAPRLRIAAALALGALPGLALLALHQRAATGGWASSQALYYATSDGPPGCFRYGFGAGIGCLGEHGDFVRHNLPDGYGLLAAAGTTLRRLKLHLVDPLNAEPLFLLVLAGAALAWRSRRARALALALLFQIAAYAPFYFDGNYPAGGARLYADVLPIEHVLAALAAAALAARARSSPAVPGASTGRWIALAAALPLAGFALRAGFDHARLRDREGGLPMFEPAVLARAGVDRGLVFVDTDHGFNLGHAPGRGDPVQVLRLRGDALDRMAWEARGRPSAFRYRFDVPEGGGPATASIAPLPFGPAGPVLIEGESLWPPRAQRGAWALPEHTDAPCASAGRWLAVHDLPADLRPPADPGALPPAVIIDLPAPWLRGALLSPRIAVAGDVAGAVRLLADGVEIHAWPVAPPPPGTPGASGAPETPCAWLDPAPIPPAAGRIQLALVVDRTARPGAAPRVFALDALSVMGGKTVDR